MLLKTPYTYKRPYLYNNYTILLVYNKCTVRNAFFLDICLFSYHKGDTSSLFTMLMIFLSDYLGLKYKIITVLYTRVVFSIMFSFKEIVDEFPVGDSVGKIPILFLVFSNTNVTCFPSDRFLCRCIQHIALLNKNVHEFNVVPQTH